MPSDARSRQLRLYKEILEADTIADIPCLKCASEGLTCRIMPNSGLKCAECVRAGKPCVDMSWTSIDKTREEYRKKVEADEKELQTVIARLLRNKRILAQAEERARKKTMCLASELAAEGESMNAESSNCVAADALVGYSPAMWATLSMLDDFAAVPASSGT